MKKLVESVPLFLTIIFAVYVIYKHSVSPFTQETLLVWILAILGLLAVGELIQRYIRLTSIDSKLSSLANFSTSLATGKLANLFLKERSDFVPFETRVKNARKIWLLGTSLEAMVSYYSGVFIEKLNDGGELRFVVIDPDSNAVEARYYGLYSVSTADVLRTDIQRTLDRLQEMKSLSRKGSIEIKLTQYIPSYGMVLIDPDKKAGEIIVELYPFLISSSDRPHFELRKDDLRWYNYFLNQFTAIWDASNEYTEKEVQKQH